MIIRVLEFIFCIGACADTAQHPPSVIPDKRRKPRRAGTQRLFSKALHDGSRVPAQGRDDEGGWGATKLLATLAVLLALTAPAASQQPELTLTYVTRDGDPAFERQRRYTGLILRQQYPARHAVEAAMKESRIVGRAIGVTFKLTELNLDPGKSPAAAVRDHMVATGSRIFVLDTPLEDLSAIAGAVAKDNVILFNPRHRTMNLRRENCRPALFHTIASDAMLADGLAQLLRKQNWARVLMLVGEHERDKITARAFAASAAKFGLNIVARRDFVLTNDPRQRDQNNIALLTQGNYDVVHLSDQAGDFGRYVPFQTALPRPVVGDHGLRPSGWHWTWERHGAPQLNQRFARKVKRDMADSDWAAWAAVKVIVEATSRTGKTDIGSLTAFLKSPQFVLDGYKGPPGSFRTWNNQLRQPILLHTHDAVIERAPLDGFLHKTSTLDTLGDDQPNSACRF